MNEIGNAELLVRFYDQNDENALSEFFLKFENLAFRIAYNVLGNTADAEDITQQTFVQILKKQAICKAAYEGNDHKVKSWLFTVIYNAARMQYNFNKKTKTFELKEGVDVEAPPINNETETQAENKDKLNNVHKAIFDLPEKYRVPILMRYNQNMSVEDISKALVAQPSTIRSIISRGISMLRNQLSSEKNMLSAGAAIELIATAPIPELQKRLSVRYIKTIQSSNPHVINAIQNYSTKNNFALKSFIAVSVVTLTAIGFLFLSHKPEQSHEQIVNAPVQTQIIQPTVAAKSLWDFSVDDGSDLITVSGKFKHDSKTHSIADIINEKNPSQTNIIFPFKIKTPLKIRISGKSNIKATINATTLGVNNTIRLTLYDKSSYTFSPSYDYFNTPAFIDINQDFVQDNRIIYLIENLSITFRAINNKITNLNSLHSPSEKDSLGIVFCGYNLEKIEFLPLDPSEEETVRKTTQDLLNTLPKRSEK